MSSLSAACLHCRRISLSPYNNPYVIFTVTTVARVDKVVVAVAVAAAVAVAVEVAVAVTATTR